MSRWPRMFVVCYDIADPKRLRKVYKTCRGYGEHLQYSVFRCVLSELRHAELQGALTQVIEPREDQVMFIDLGPASIEGLEAFEALGLPLSRPEANIRVV